MKALGIRFLAIAGLWFGCGLALSAPPPATHYFIYPFSFDDGAQTPARTHTWATFVSVTPGAKGAAPKVDALTISWLPVSGVITALALGPERGRNYSLKESFDWAVREQIPLAEWGPYEITQELFERAGRFKSRLDAGEFWYRVLDTPNRIFKVLDPTSVLTPRAVMCSHAVADVVYDGDPRGFLLTGRAAGFLATSKVVWHLTDWFVRTPGDPQYLQPVDGATKAAIDRALDLADMPARQHQDLKSQNNQYCRTLEECRQNASLVDFNN